MKSKTKNDEIKQEKIISQIIDSSTYEQLKTIVNSFEIDKSTIIKIIDSRLNKSFSGKIDNNTLDKLINLYKFIADKFSENKEFKSTIDNALKIEKEYESELGKLLDYYRVENDKKYYEKRYYEKCDAYNALKSENTELESKVFDYNLLKTRNQKLEQEVSSLKEKISQLENKPKISENTEIGLSYQEDYLSVNEEKTKRSKRTK